MGLVKKKRKEAAPRPLLRPSFLLVKRQQTLSKFCRSITSPVIKIAMSLQAFLEDLSSTTPVDFDPERDPTDASGPADGSGDEAFAEETAADPRAHYVDVG